MAACRSDIGMSCIFYEKNYILCSIEYRIVINRPKFYVYKSEWLFQNLIYSECMSDVAGVSAFAVYMPLKITEIDDTMTMATIMITMYHQLTHGL